MSGRRGRSPLPPDLRGRDRGDRALAPLPAVVRVYEQLSRISGRRRPPVTAVDRDLRLVITRIAVEAEDVVSLQLARPDGSALPFWRPGAHIDVVLPSGRVRQYSLCGDTHDRTRYRIAVRRIDEGGGGSTEVHEALKPGAELTVRGPRNAFPFVPARSYLFIAGGIGITPILPMVRSARAEGADWRLVYTGRSPGTMPFTGELASYGERVWLRPDTEYGVPASGAELLEHAPAGAAVYCCGPPPMIAGVRVDLARGPARPVHYERFAAAPVVDGRPFRLRLARSGRELTVPADRTALEVVREVLPDVAYSCRQGFCRTCVVRVLHGEVDHRDAALTDTERSDSMLVCVSRARHDELILDL
ncbi:Ferredoxin-NADP reductase [Amycolatopsis marina]|uniref:Ferredoxin-NADP reductase n=1 Tax=Amycolatopsis marina TaxID=490629 RepID=A0A1I0ZCT7_9PSEU|nr:PDR/VanB family oxidoreductase [Amycolatopsis marina]SFB23212.1 Ferredoxin-NADP reductase [Amycolatopsis marina]